MSTTPTGVPYIDCDKCGLRHPESRDHCRVCGKPTAFITPIGLCLTCDTKATTP